MTLSDKIIPITANMKKCLNDFEKCVRSFPQSEPFIGIKNPSTLREVVSVPWHPILIDVVCWVDYNFKGEVVITSGHRKGETGIHGTNPLRACDLRSRYFEVPKKAMEEINNAWDYGKAPYNVCLYHRVGKCLDCGAKINLNPDIGVTPKTYCVICKSNNIEDYGPHFHIQVRNETKRRDT